MDQTPNYQGTPYVPIYVMLPFDVLVGYANGSRVKAPGDLTNDLKSLKSVGVDGVMVDCWWGLVEGYSRQYNWSGYKKLFQIVRDEKLKLQVVMSFHPGVVSEYADLRIPEWVRQVGTTNPDIFFTDQHGNRNREYLSFGVDTERLFDGRTAIEMYYDFMKSFRQEFHNYFEDDIITGIQVGLGPCGELRYPSYPAAHWRYPGIGEFQCYDKYLQKSLTAAAVAKGHQNWAHCPDNAGGYNNRPSDTEFFKDGGDYDSWYGRFFVNWYAQTLIQHGDRVLALARLAFYGTRLSAKVSGVHWFYQTQSHAAELTAGYNNSSNRDAYAPVAAMLAKNDVALDFTCLELRTELENNRALSDPERLVWQVLNAAWDAGVKPAAENALRCYDGDSYNQILRAAKPSVDADGRHISAFTYLRHVDEVLKTEHLKEFEDFVKRLHGTSSGESQPNNPYLT